MKLDFSGQIFKKSSNIKFNENPSSGNAVVPCEQTDRQTRRPADRRRDRCNETNSRFSQFCQVPKKLYIILAECIYVLCTGFRT